MDWWRSVMFVLLCTAVPISVAAQASDSFLIQLGVFGDMVPPSAPSAVTATPVTPTQIDLDWDPATDNVLVDGYVVFRDASAIATTTLTSYADTGLVPSTTYSYSVRAFDTARNYSSSSVSVATTTLPLPVATSTPTTTATTSTDTRDRVSSRAALTLLGLVVSPDQTSALFTWKTDRYSRYGLRWGRSSSYELGYIASDVYNFNHRTVVTDLQPGTVYEYALVGYDANGFMTVLARDRLTTMTAPDLVPPPNVSDLFATREGDGVRLSWQNPRVGDFSHVRVVRSHLFYPLDPSDGFIVYEGAAFNSFDQSAFTLAPDQFYTVFSYDRAGNYSSGAVVYITQARGPTSYVPPVVATTTETAVPAAITPRLSIRDLRLTHGGTSSWFEAGRVTIDNTGPITLSIPYDRLPEHLKTITVTVTHPDAADSVFSFLLRVNRDKSAYEATIAPLPTPGAYDLAVTVFDYQAQSLMTITGTLVVQQSVLETTSVSPVRHPVYWYFAGVGLGLLAIMQLFFWRRRRTEDSALR